MNPVYLLDVKALIAFQWPAHSNFDSVNRWWRDAGRPNWATCPFTETGFVRLRSSPVAYPEGIELSEAVSILALTTDRVGHEFWAADLTMTDATKPFGYRL